jgi:hypothetical protein
VVENKKRKRKRNRRNTVASGEEAKKGVTAAPSTRTAGAPKPSVAAATMKDTRQKMVTLPRAPRTSAVTLTLSEGAKMSYADVVATAREKITLEEIGVGAVGMKKTMTGAILIRVPGDKDGGKASLLATRLAEVLDPTAVKIEDPTRTAELRVVGIDISVKKEELRQALASAAGCSSAEGQVGEIGISRGGLGSAWIKCPVAGARKLAQEGKVKLGWSIAKVIAIPKRPLQCYRCLEMGHVQATCVSSVDRRHLCYIFGRTSPGTMSAPAAPKCSLCDLLGAPANHRMGGAACAPPPRRSRRNHPTADQPRRHGEGAPPKQRKMAGRRPWS